MAFTPEEAVKFLQALDAAGLIKGELPKEELKPAEEVTAIMAFPSALDQISEEEVLFWSTDHYDVLQAEKEAKKQRIEEEKLERS